MSESWAVAGIWFLGLVILVAAAIVVWPRKRKPLGHFDARVGRDAYREFVSK